jgi:YHS domain-containing protein
MIFSICLTLFASFAQVQEQPVPPENTVCPVLGQKVDEKSSTVVVKGRTYRICCPPCAPKLQKDPDKYLNPDGSLKKKK